MLRVKSCHLSIILGLCLISLSRSDICSVSYVRSAAATLLNNLWNAKFGFTLPSRSVQIFQSSTASTLAAFANSQSDAVSHAKTELKSILSLQREDGRIPEYSCPDGCATYINGTIFPGMDVWFGNDSTAGISAFPFHATAALAIYEFSSDESFLKDVYDSIFAFHKYLHTQRADCGGNVMVLHPWETVIAEYSNLWSTALAAAISAANDAHYNPTIPQQVQQNPNYPGDDVYTAELYLADCFVQHNNDAAEVVKHCPFAMLDSQYLAVLYEADENLLSLSEYLSKDEDKNTIKDWIQQDQASLAILYDSSRDLYVNQLVTFDESGTCDLNAISATTPDQVSYASPLLTGLTTSKQANDITNRLMAQTNGFLCADVPFSAEACGSNMDRHIWVHQNLMIAAGFEQIDSHDFSTWVRNATFMLICNTTGQSSETDGTLFSRVFAGNLRQPIADMYGVDSAMAAASAVLFDHFISDDDSHHGPPIGHDVIFALIIIALSMAFGIGAMCFLFSYNLLRNLKDAEANPALADVRTAAPGAAEDSPRSPAGDYRQFPDDQLSRQTSPPEQQQPQQGQGWWGIISPYAQYLRIW